jgi:hypothetical protein
MGGPVLVMFEGAEGFYVGDFLKCKRYLSNLCNWKLNMHSKFLIQLVGYKVHTRATGTSNTGFLDDG